MVAAVIVVVVVWTGVAFLLGAAIGGVTRKPTPALPARQPATVRLVPAARLVEQLGYAHDEIGELRHQLACEQQTNANLEELVAALRVKASVECYMKLELGKELGLTPIQVAHRFETVVTTAHRGGVKAPT